MVQKWHVTIERVNLIWAPRRRNMRESSVVINVPADPAIRHMTMLQRTPDLRSDPQWSYDCPHWDWQVRDPAEELCGKTCDTFNTAGRSDYYYDEFHDFNPT